MESNQLYIRHVQINHSPKQSRGESFAVGFEPSNRSLPEKGNIYLLIERPKKDKSLNFEKLISATGEAYYEESSENSFEERFKKVLRSINSILKDGAQDSSIVVVAILDNKMLFSDIGDATLLLIRNGQNTNLSSKSKSARFKEIGQGKLRTKDKIFIASSHLSDIFNLTELSAMASEQSAKVFSEQVTKKISHSNPDINCSILLITALIKKTESFTEEAAAGSTKPAISEAKFRSIMLSIQKSLKSTSANSKKKIRKLAANRSDIAQKITTKTKGGWTAFWSKYINPNPKQAIIVVVSTIIIILTVIWVFSLFLAKPKLVIQLENAQDLISSAQSSLAKNNQSSAQESIDKAQDILSKISTGDQQKLDELAKIKKINLGYSSAKSELKYLDDKLSSTTRISNQNSFDITQSNLKSLVWLSGSLYGLDTDSAKLIEINPLLGAPSVRAASPELSSALTMDNFNDSGLLILSKNSLIQYTTDKGLQKLSNYGNSGAIDIAGYLSNVYLLSPGEGQVIRYAKSGLNLSSKSSILRNTPANEFKNATSFAVNGNIFVAVGNKILLFEQGSERSYRINNLPNSFGKIKDLYYSKEGGYFVILNESSKRLALLSADPESANFIKQYAIDDDSKISSFTIEPKNSQLLINSGNKIFTYKIEK